MKEFDQLIKTTEHLMGPDGCPWDREQTLMSLRESVLEETCELIEAVDLDDNEHIKEELGDLLFNVVFFCKVGEKEGRFQTTEVVSHLTEKLIRRHPHVFGEAKVDGIDGLWKQWNAIKAQEKGKTDRESILDGIPKGLPALALAQKMLKKICKNKGDFEQLPKACELEFKDEEALGGFLLGLVRKAQETGLDAEQALRKSLAELEASFRQTELKNL